MSIASCNNTINSKKRKEFLKTYLQEADYIPVIGRDSTIRTISVTVSVSVSVSIMIIAVAVVTPSRVSQSVL